MKKRFLIFSTLILTLSLISFATVNLTFWNMPFSTGEVGMSYVNWFQQNVKTALPNINVSTYYGPGQYDAMLKAFVVQATTGQPAVIEGLTEEMDTYVKMGLIADLDQYFNTWSEKDQFLPNAIAACEVNGKLYGIPYNINVRGLLYRKDIFAKYNLKVPTTWSELVTTAASITELTGGKVYGFDFCSSVNEPRAFQEFMSWFDQVNNREQMFVNVDGKWKLNATVAEFQKIFQLYYDLTFDNAPYTPFNQNNRGGTWEQEDLGYIAGKYAMVPMGPWIWGHITDNALAKTILEDDSAVTSLPIPTGGVQAAYLEVKPIMMNKYTKDPSAAWDLIKFITSEKAMAGWDSAEGTLPPRTDAMNDPAFNNWWAKSWEALLPEGVGLAPINWNPPEYSILTAMDTVIYGVSTPQEAATWLYNKLNELASSGVLGS